MSINEEKSYQIVHCGLSKPQPAGNLSEAEALLMQPVVQDATKQNRNSCDHQNNNSQTGIYVTPKVQNNLHQRGKPSDMIKDCEITVRLRSLKKILVIIIIIIILKTGSMSHPKYKIVFTRKVSPQI